jgi:hypothetical protein
LTHWLPLGIRRGVCESTEVCKVLSLSFQDA